jgi:hypothetical protein
MPKTLAIQFNAEGHFLRQFWREGDVAIYERSLSEKHEPHELELVLIKIAPEKKMPDGNLVLAHETYPSASHWGSIAWSIPIRHKDSILALARDVLGISKGRADVVRQKIRELSALDRHRL